MLLNSGTNVGPLLCVFSYDPQVINLFGTPITTNAQAWSFTSMFLMLKIACVPHFVRQNYVIIIISTQSGTLMTCN